MKETGTHQQGPSVALVTGGARRIGRAICLALARAGWKVGVHHLASREEAREVMGEIDAAGGRAALLQADLSQRGDVEGLIGACTRALGAPTLLVNNASIFEDDTIESLDWDQWDTHQAINLRAPIFLSKAFAAALPPGKQGSIVNIADQRVWRPVPLFLSYSISKAGLWAATQMLAQALAPSIRVNAIGPGPVLRSIHQSEEQFARQAAATPLQRGTSPEEIARAVLFILDQPAMTGQLIALDGGQHLAWRTPDVVDVEG